MLPLLAGLALLISVQVGSVQAPGEPEPAAVVPLEQVFRDPRPYLDRELQVTFQVRSVPEHWNPYLTRFGTRDYVAAEVWGDGQYLWIQRDFESPLGLVFARRGSPVGVVLAEAETYQRFTARVHVRQVFGSRPWAEILELTPERRAVSEGTILHASRALTLMSGDEYQIARDDLRRAAAPLLPQHVRDELQRLIGICNRELAERKERELPVRRAR